MTATQLSPFGLPAESIYRDLRHLPALIEIALLDALAQPCRMYEIVEQAKADAQRLADVTELHLRGAVERATRRENAADRAIAAGEKRVGAALRDIIAGGPDLLDPHGFYVYQLWGDDPDCPLYVGRSTNVYSRLGTHMTDRTKRHRVKRITAIRCRTERQMEATEARLIAHHQPPLNIAGIGNEPTGAAG